MWASNGTVVEYVRINPDCDVLGIVCSIVSFESTNATHRPSLGIWGSKGPCVSTCSRCYPCRSQRSECEGYAALHFLTNHFQDNILMSYSGVPKLTDFGQSRALNNSQAVLRTTAYDRVKGTANWMAYELLGFLDGSITEIICTKASDVWAFGMVIYASSCYPKLYLLSDYRFCAIL